MTLPKRPHPNIRVVLVDDHPLFRNGLVSSLSLANDIEIIGQEDDGARGLKTIRQTHPHIALLDMNLPTMSGLEVLRVLRDESQPTKVIVLTAHHDDEQVLHVIRAGAYAYANKNIDAELLIKIIRVVTMGYYVVNGRRMTAEQVHDWLDEQMVALAGPYGSVDGEPFSPLSPREVEILKCVTQGLSNKEVAFHLRISQQTVKNHMTSILKKLNVKDRTQAAVLAIRRGWVRIQD
ncbi:MAG: response regulator [Phototrophicaceae bacterium]|jgi:DNA-binding NarL/FixJ family response regulator